MASRSAVEASPWRTSLRALPRLSRRAGFWAIAFSFLALSAFSTAPSPRYGLYEHALTQSGLEPCREKAQSQAGGSDVPYGSHQIQL
jgi:hypothetical protein